MSRKPYKFTAPRRALVLKAISDGKTQVRGYGVGRAGPADAHNGYEAGP